MKRIKAAEDEARRAHITDSKTISTTGDTDRPSTAESIKNDIDETANSINVLRPYNQRIELSLEDDEDKFGQVGNFDDDGSIDGMDDEELTRDKVKRASSQILQAMDKRKKKPKKKTSAAANSAE